MATSQRAFDQVKSILGKLDRDIDAARARRTQDPVAPSTVPASIALPTTPAPLPAAPRATAAPSTIPAATLGGAPVAPSARPSPFGRATPMRMTRPSNMTGT